MSQLKINNFKKAVKNFELVMIEDKTDIVRDCAIKRYEICYELAWKSIQEALKNEGIEICKTPKSCFKKAFQLGWITDETSFADMVKNRNLTTHTYDKALANAIYGNFTQYLALLKALLKKINE